MFNRRDYVIVGKFSEIDISNFDFSMAIKKEGNQFKIDKKKLKMIIAGGLSLLVIALLTDVSFAADIHTAIVSTVATDNAIPAMVMVTQPQPTQLGHIFEYIRWLIQLLRLIVSSVAGLICTFAGYKWATTIDGSGAETAKKIMKNAFVGGLIVFGGATIADFFVGKMEQILL